MSEASVHPTLLAVFAHPDDETFRCGGTLALLAARGVRVHLVTATRGEAGSAGDPPLCSPEELGAWRGRELRCACRALGLEPPQLLDYPDGKLTEADPDEVIGRIVRAARELRPQVMLTYGPDGVSGHPDHVAIGRLAAAAFQRAAEESAYPEQLAQGLVPFAPARLYQLAVPRSLAERLGMGQVRPVPDEEVTLAVDVMSAWEAKMAAIRCHASQVATSPMLRASPERQRLFLGTETFRLAASRFGPLGPERDMLEGLDDHPSVEDGGRQDQ
jgi:LmbE family N-acetylglucosaminyl deacetylase